VLRIMRRSPIAANGVGGSSRSTNAPSTATRLKQSAKYQVTDGHGVHENQLPVGARLCASSRRARTSRSPCGNFLRNPNAGIAVPSPNAQIVCP